jgi:hypothetical protein
MSSKEHSMTKQHFIWMANYIRTAPVSDTDKHMLAAMAIAAGTNFNGKFRTDTFLKACGLAPTAKAGTR